MKKFSESTSGHRDVDGNWVDETPQAKLRNSLGPFWTLSEIISGERLEMLKDKDMLDMLIRIAKQCEENKDSILELIRQTEIKKES